LCWVRRVLTGRYLLPAAARRQAAGPLGDGVMVLGVERHDHSDDTFRAGGG
jgi:hypothetical protein